MDPVNEYGPTETQYRGVDQAKDDKPFEESYAAFSERFAALLIDSVLVTYVIATLFRFLGNRLPAHTINWSSPRSWLSLEYLPIVGVVTALIFAYFFIFEGILARTPGKLLCGLSVTHKMGGPPPLFGVIIRNVFRFIDILLFPITGFGLAEISERRQRLGDMLGGTTVRRSRELGTPLSEETTINWGSVSRRMVALILDLAIYGVTILFFLLCLPVSRTELTKEILAIGPLLLIAYWVLCETLAGGTPAKLLFGLRVVDEETRPVGVGGSLLRNLFRVLDHNPLGYLCAILASRKQRPGDLAARSSVIKTGWSFRRFISLLLLVAVIAGLGYFGTHNADSFIRKEQVLRIGPWQLPDLPSRLKYLLGMRLKIGSFHFGQSHAPSTDAEPLYTPGEIVYLTADISGYITKDNSVWLQQDILVTDPEGDTLIDLLNVINKRYPASPSGLQPMTSSFLLPLRIKTGSYKASIRVRDRYGNMIGEAKKSFLVK